MACILKISEAASLALHTVVYLATQHDGLVSTKQIARVLHASEAHLSKVLQRLARVGIVSSIRGPKGGFALHKPADAISLLEVYEAIEGPLALNNCLGDHPSCSGKQCVLGTLIGNIHDQVSKYLSKTTVSKLNRTYLTEHSHVHCACVAAAATT
jgi:Rrf2 family protein